MTFFDLVLSTRASLHPEVEPDEFISSYNGVIRMDCDPLSWTTSSCIHAGVV